MLSLLERVVEDLLELRELLEIADIERALEFIRGRIHIYLVRYETELIRSKILGAGG